MRAKKAASEVGRALVAIRWAKYSPEERSEQQRRAAETALKGLSKKERSDRMRALIEKRWEQPRPSVKKTRRRRVAAKGKVR